MSYVICKECGEKNPINALYCQECGRKVIKSQFYEKILSMAKEEVTKDKKIWQNKLEQTENPLELFNFKIEIKVDQEMSNSQKTIMYTIVYESLMLNYSFNDFVKEGLAKDLIEGMEKQLMPYETTKKMSIRLNGNLDLAKQIEHAEIMRAAHFSSWIQSKVDEMNFFCNRFL